MNSVFVFTVLMVVGREIPFLAEHATYDAARAKHAGEADVRHVLVGYKIADVDDPALQPREEAGCRYWHVYVHRPDGRNDAMAIESYATLAECRAGVAERRRLDGYRDHAVIYAREAPFPKE